MNSCMMWQRPAPYVPHSPLTPGDLGNTARAEFSLGQLTDGVGNLTFSLQAIYSSAELIQRKTTSRFEGKSGHTHLDNKVTVSLEERPPNVVLEACPKECISD